jgi:hypothetical protein
MSSDALIPLFGGRAGRFVGSGKRRSTILRCSISPTSARPPPFDSHRDRQNSSQSPNDARVTSFRVAYLPGFVNRFAGKAYLGRGRWANIVPNGNDVCPDRAGSDFTAFLRRVVFVG